MDVWPHQFQSGLTNDYLVSSVVNWCHQWLFDFTNGHLIARVVISFYYWLSWLPVIIWYHKSQVAILVALVAIWYQQCISGLISSYLYSPALCWFTNGYFDSPVAIWLHDWLPEIAYGYLVLPAILVSSVAIWTFSIWTHQWLSHHTSGHRIIPVASWYRQRLSGDSLADYRAHQVVAVCVRRLLPGLVGRYLDSPLSSRTRREASRTR